jgi:hypothetical protein
VYDVSEVLAASAISLDEPIYYTYQIRHTCFKTKNARAMVPAVRRGALTAEVITQINYGKSKVIPVHDMKTYRGCRGTVPLILNLRARWKWMVNITPRPL